MINVRPPDNINEEGADSEDKSLRSVPPEPNSPPAPTNKTKSCKNSRKSLEIATFVVELLALVGLALYAGLTYKMWREMQHQTRINQNQFRKLHRPYVGILEIIGDVNRQSPTEWKLAATARNYGETPARGVYTYGVFKETPEDWRTGTCYDMTKTKDIKTAGPAIFQGSEPETIEIDVKPATWPPPKYLAVCVSFMDVQGPFPWTDEKRRQIEATYNIKHLFEVIPEKGKLTFKKTYTSVEGAEPE